MADFAFVRRTSATTAVGTSFAAFDTSGALDVTVDAAAGDLIEVGLSARVTNVAVSFYLDAATRVGGSNVNWMSNGSGTAATEGVGAWTQPAVAAFSMTSGSVLYTVQSGDISSGQVTLRLFGKTSSSTRNLSCSATEPVQFWVVNHRTATSSKVLRTSSTTGATTSGSFTEFDNTGAFDVTIAASAGDIVQVGLCARTTASLQEFFLDAATLVSGSPVNWVSNGSGTGATDGVQAWHNIQSNIEKLAGSVLYTVQSGDISSGQVTFRLYGRSSSRNIDASTSRPAQFFAVKR